MSVLTMMETIDAISMIASINKFTYRPSSMTPVRLQQISTRVAFFIAGFALAAWAPLVPFAKDRAGLDEAALGLLLLCFGAGSIVSMPLAGTLASRLGCRAMIAATTILISITLPFLACVDSFSALAAALLLFGAAVGTVDVVVNIQAVIVERASSRSMMSGFHGLFSVGGIVGALSVSTLLFLGASPLIATLAVVGVILALLAGFGKHLLPYGSHGGEARLILPRGPVLTLGLLCFITFLAEGAMLDWSAVFLTSRRGVTPGQAGFGYAVFAIAMTLGRLNGDRCVQALGGKRILLFGSLCAAAGLAVAVLVPIPAAALVGFVLVGVGCSNLVPVLYSAAGSQSAMPAGAAISAITTIGYSGILVGPALIGFVAQAATLSIAFMGVATLLLLVARSSHVAVR
jgi:predicted MFS family arabinose efflux permease